MKCSTQLLPSLPSYSIFHHESGIQDVVIASPSQLQTKFDEVEELKMFKTKAVTIFAVVQFGMAFFAWAMKFI